MGAHEMPSRWDFKLSGVSTGVCILDSDTDLKSPETLTLRLNHA